MMVWTVEDHLFWLDKEILVNPRFAETGDVVAVADPEVNALRTEADLGVCVTIHGPAPLADGEEFPSFPRPNSVLDP